MSKKLIEFKESLGKDVTYNKKEYILTLAVCVLSGILVGLIISPRRDMIIGSLNGNGCSPFDQDDDDNNKEE